MYPIKSVHCLFCHGYEDRGCASAGVLAVGDVASPGVALHMARMGKRLTQNVTVYTDGAEELGEQIALGLKGSVSGIKVDKRRIRRLAKGPERSEVDMVFEDGSQIREGFLVRLIPRSRFFVRFRPRLPRTNGVLSTDNRCFPGP